MPKTSRTTASIRNLPCADRQGKVLADPEKEGCFYRFGAFLVCESPRDPCSKMITLSCNPRANLSHPTPTRPPCSLRRQITKRFDEGMQMINREAFLGAPQHMYDDGSWD
jgi:hypothetical protein